MVLIIIKREIADKVIGVCNICGNESIYNKDEEVICNYCQEYYHNAIKYGDINRLMQYVFIRDGLYTPQERRESLDNFRAIAGDAILKCISCGTFQRDTGSHICDCCEAGVAVGDNYYLLDNGYMCKTCLSVVDEKTEICKGCVNLQDNPRKTTKYLNNYEGRVYNNLQVLRQYRAPTGILCDVKCLWMDCKEIYTGVPLYDVVRNKVFCTNPNEFMSVHCAGCGNIERLNNTEVYYRDYKCKKCGVEIGLNLRLYANDVEQYTDFKVKYLNDTYEYSKEIKNGALTADTGISNLYKVAPIWNTRHLIMDRDELENSQFRLGGRVGDGLFSTDVIWNMHTQKII